MVKDIEKLSLENHNDLCAIFEKKNEFYLSFSLLQSALS